MNTGCLPVVAGGAAAGGYYVGQDERGVKVIITDASITASVKAKLIADSNVKGSKINVDTNKGVVVLTGRVFLESEKAAAAKIAASVNGVVSVKNSLSVIP